MHRVIADGIMWQSARVDLQGYLALLPCRLTHFLAYRYIYGLSFMKVISKGHPRNGPCIRGLSCFVAAGAYIVLSQDILSHFPPAYLPVNKLLFFHGALFSDHSSILINSIVLSVLPDASTIPSCDNAPGSLFDLLERRKEKLSSGYLPHQLSTRA